MGDVFHKISSRISLITGSPGAFITAIIIIAVWAITGPIFNFSDTWQLIINTGTTIVTFLMVFLIQNTQNRDSVAIQIKLDELLRGVKGAKTSMVDIEDLSDADLEKLQQHFRQMHEHYSKEVDKRGKTTKTTEDKKIDFVK